MTTTGTEPGETVGIFSGGLATSSTTASGGGHAAAGLCITSLTAHRPSRSRGVADALRHRGFLRRCEHRVDGRDRSR